MLEASERTPERNGASAAVDDYLALRINAMDLEYRLGDVETDSRDRLYTGASNCGSLNSTQHSWHSRADGGAVHSINSRN